MGYTSIFKSKKSKERVKGKYVLITGAAQGIGYETAVQFAAAGAHLILTDIDTDRLDAAERSLRAYPKSQLFCYTVDVANKQQVEHLAQQVEAEIGRLDILINNAGIGYHGALESTSLATWKRLIDINIWGSIYHIYAFLPLFKKQKAGQIVNVSSGQAYFRIPSWGAYAATKLMIGAISDILHFELQAYNIKVTTVFPYVVNTGFYKAVKGQSLGAKLSMKLLPFYAQKPSTVGKIIFNAIVEEKRIEMVNILNSLAKTVHFFNPVSNLFIKLANNMLNDTTFKGAEGLVYERLEAIASGLADLTNAVVGQTGFELWEVMSGEHEFVDGPAGKLPFEFQIDWGAASIVDFLNPFDEQFLSNRLSGTVTIGGLCTAAPCTGRLDLNYFSEQKIRYTFDFEVAGTMYQYIGEKRNIYPWNILYSHTTCFGELRIKETRQLISTSITHFHWDTLWTSAKSFKIVKA